MDFSKQIIEQKEFPLDDGFVTLIKADSSYATAKAVMAEVERHKSVKASKKAEDEHEAKLSEIYAEHLISGWRGLTIGGREIPFSKANAKKLMKHKGFKSFVLTTVTSGDFSEDVDLGLDFDGIEKN